MFCISVIAPLLLLLLSATAHGEVYLGEVRCMAITFTPRGFLKADGATLSISENQALFSLLGKFFFNFYSWSIFASWNVDRTSDNLVWTKVAINVSPSLCHLVIKVLWEFSTTVSFGFSVFLQSLKCFKHLKTQTVLSTGLFSLSTLAGEFNKP